MVFTSHIFVFYFLPAVLLVYYYLPMRLRNVLLTLASYVFYGWWEPWFVLLMMFTTVLDFASGWAIAMSRHRPAICRGALVTSIVINLALLGFFKYYMFSMENLNWLREQFGAGPFRVLEITLPIGISFYTFQSMSYTVDVYRGIAPPVKSFADFSCFVSLFPHLVAGPILRYNTLAHQLSVRSHTLPQFSSGVALFILGFAKKILLANPMGTIADAVFGAASFTTADAWFGVVAYAFQIYFDFCGYSDMAVGLGRMFGFEIPRNFDAPYRAESITDFWRRWHISLSTFLRDYLYIPLGGNRLGPARTYANLLIVMLLGGLWHGAQWTFIVWGAFHGTMLAAERFLGKRSAYATLPHTLRVAMTFVLVLFSWVLFRAPTLAEAGNYMAAMLGRPGEGSAALLLSAELYTPARIVMMLLCAVLVLRPVQAFEWVDELTWPRVVVLIPLFMLCLAVMFTQAFNPFLYFQF